MSLSFNVFFSHLNSGGHSYPAPPFPSSVVTPIQIDGQYQLTQQLRGSLLRQGEPKSAVDIPHGQGCGEIESMIGMWQSSKHSDVI